MARQSSTPVSFQRSTRRDEAVVMTSGRAGKCQMVQHIPLLRGDSMSGRVGMDVELAEMPRPLLNGVVMTAQAWFVPKSAHPQFSGMDEFMHSYQGESIKSLGASDRSPPEFFTTFQGSDVTTIKGSEMFKRMGLHVPAGAEIQSDMIDAFWLVYNFRLAAHSSRLPRGEYAAENLAAATQFPPAFWPSGMNSRIVPDYERALVVGNLDLDIVAGRLPIEGLSAKSGAAEFFNDGATAPGLIEATDNFDAADKGAGMEKKASWIGHYRDVMIRTGTTGGDSVRKLYADMAGQTVGTTLADIDMARTTQAFAKLRTAYAGNDATGFDNDDAIVAELMQGFSVPDDLFKRPWLLDSARVPFGMIERHATDAANLDASVSQGRASATLSLNVPVQDTGGTVIITVEVLPERLDERRSDEWLHVTTPSQLPNALRDVQRPEPVDMVLSRRIDAAHDNPNALYGYEPMNAVWERAATRLGGDFYQADPYNPWTEARSAIWQTSIVNPEFTADHWLAPDEFPHNVFSDPTADAFEVVSRHSVAIQGLTQMGDVLAENNDDYEAVVYDDAAE